MNQADVVIDIDKEFNELTKAEEESRYIFLKQATSDFLNNCNKKIIQEIEGLLATRDTVQSVYKRAFQFDKALHTFLSSGKVEKKVHFVKENNGNRTVIEIPYEDFHNLITEKLRIINVGLNRRSKIQLETEYKQLEGQEIRKKHLLKLQLMAKVIEKKMRKNTVTIEYGQGENQKTMRQMRQSQVFRYDSQSNNNKILHSLLNIGDLNEAYAAARYDILYMKKKELPKSITYEWFFKNYIQPIDNAEAIISEDIVRTTNSKEVSIAVKSKSAKAPGLTQYFEAANVVNEKIIALESNKRIKNKQKRISSNAFKKDLFSEIKKSVQKSAPATRNKEKQNIEEEFISDLVEIMEEQVNKNISIDILSREKMLF